MHRFDINYNTTSVTSIDTHAFDGCTSLTSITIPDNVLSIDDYSFRVCTSLKSVTIGSGVTNLSSSAFLGCSSLESIIVAEENTTYTSGNGANCIISTNTLILGCKNTTIPNNVKGIGSYAFFNCTGLKSITIPNSVTWIGDSTFYGCTGLTSITIPESVTNIHDFAFKGCTGLTSITIPNSVTYFGQNVFSDTYLFNNANDGDLIYVSRADGKRWLLGYKTTFDGNLIILDDVIGIASAAFSGCPSLTITLESTTPPMLGTLVIPATTVIYVPNSSLETYKTATGWSDYASNIHANLIDVPTTFTGETGSYKVIGREYMYTDKITIEVKAYMDNWSEYTARLVSSTEGGGWNVFYSNGGKLYAEIYDSGVGYKTIATTVAWADLSSGWHTFKLTFDGEYAKVYVDGLLCGTSASFTSGLIGYHASNSIIVGAEAGSGSVPGDSARFIGKIEYVRIENNVS
ncbi:MAG: leucine-rich repeat protein [Christensenellales bacterium]